MANQIPIFDFSFGDTVESIEKLTADLKLLKQTFKTLNPKDANFLTLGNEIKAAESQLKTLNAVTKDGVNSLGGINKASKFAAGSYGELKQKIEEQKKALLSLNIESEDFANSQKELIDLQNQRIEIEKKIPSLFQERIKGAIDESNSLKQLREDLKAAKAAALNGDGAAAQRVAELTDQMDDLRDSTQTLQGSGVEKLNTSMGLLTEGFQNLDIDKIKTGFKGIGAAMSAIPLILLIEGIKALIDNFDAVVEFGKKITGSFNEVEKEINTLTLAVEENEIANKGLISQYDNEIAILTALGGNEKEIIDLKKKKIATQILEQEDIVRLNTLKASEILLNETLTDSIKKGIAITLRNIGLNEEAENLEKEIQEDRKSRAQENIKLAQDGLISIAASKTALQVLDITYNKQQVESAKKTKKEKHKLEIESYNDSVKVRDELIKDLEDKEATELKIYKDSADAIWEINLANANKEKELKQQQLYDNVTAANAALLNANINGETELKLKKDKLNAEKEVELASVEDNEYRKSEIIAKYRNQENQLKANQAEKDLTLASNLSASLGALSDSLFVVRRANLQKGSDEDRRLAKQQFDSNKVFSIATAAISGAVAVINASASVPYLPVGLAASIAASATTTATIAKIASQKFQYFDGGYTQQGTPTEQAESIGNSQFHKGEYVIPNKILSTPTGAMMASQLEAMRKGFSKSNISGFFDGGFTARSASSNVVSNSNLQNSILETISSMPAPVVRVTDINKVSKRNEVSINVSGL